MKPRVFIVQPVPPEPLGRLARHAEIDMFDQLDRMASRDEMMTGIG